MATQVPADVFPIATQDGTQIRYEIARPRKLTKLPVAVGSDIAYTRKDTQAILMIYATVDVAVLFEKNVGTINNVGGLFIAAGERAMFFVDSGIDTLYIRGESAAGSVYVHEFDSWHGLTTQEASVTL